jgi:hypothetical protein
MSTAEGYVTGLEPGSNYPNPRSFEGEQGRVIKLPPRGSATIGLQLAVHGTPAEVEAAEKNVQALQRRAEPRVFMEPQPGWCPPSEKPKN